MKFALNEDVEKIISPDGTLQLHRLNAEDWALLRVFYENEVYSELTTLTEKQWRVIWKMLTEK